MPDNRSYRERAELFAFGPENRIYGGFYPGQGFGTFGGGVDPGEDPQEAAAREFIEESGYPVSNVRQAPVGPYVEDWKPLSKKPEYANDPKFQERFKKFKGSRTHYFVGDIEGQRGPRGAEEASFPFESVRFRKIPTVISRHKKDLRSLADPIDIARLQQRLAVLQSLQEKNAMPFKSKAQQRFMFASEAEGELPKGTAKRWANETEKKKGGIEALPEKVGKRPMKKSAAEIAEKICTPEEKAKCCAGESEKKEEKKDDKSEDKGNPFAKKDEKSEDKGNPFAKKEAASCGSSGKSMPKKKGFKSFPKKNVNMKKTASEIADIVLHKTALDFGVSIPLGGVSERGADYTDDTRRRMALGGAIGGGALGALPGIMRGIESGKWKFNAPLAALGGLGVGAAGAAMMNADAKKRMEIGPPIRQARLDREALTRAMLQEYMQRQQASQGEMEE
jgi:8-oxo-dGTP pyrophosphatase MutT (NUDIX family)